MTGWGSNFGVQNIFHAWGHWILGFKAGTAQNSRYIVFLQHIKVWLSVRFKQLEVLPAEYSSSMRVL